MTDYVKLFRPATGDTFKALRTDSAGIADLLREGWEIAAAPAQSAQPVAIVLPVVGTGATDLQGNLGVTLVVQPSPTAVVLDERAAFEAHWCRDVPLMYRNAALFELKANRDGERYKRDEVQWAWEAWQASRRAALEEAAKHVETLALVFFFGEQEFAKNGRACTADAIRALSSGDTE